ncbi:hypothetical protein Agabi119p4_6912 [Agaricus bisporus var. burnettii]|uniref:Uncharacterized protein n=1 Tax=Agaricus bisporus var. burnettii TaxID=192524 RepID=A0A8H7F0F2_AGABI|nr:hypothetical protein Agabi119p4_6912 [Agaricus bisporus var. burnettii]
MHSHVFRHRTRDSEESNAPIYKSLRSSHTRLIALPVDLYALRSLESYLNNILEQATGGKGLVSSINNKTIYTIYPVIGFLGTMIFLGPASH